MSNVTIFNIVTSQARVDDVYINTVHLLQVSYSSFLISKIASQHCKNEEYNDLSSSDLVHLKHRIMFPIFRHHPKRVRDIDDFTQTVDVPKMLNKCGEMLIKIYM